MTEEEAYYEWRELERLKLSWEKFDIDSEYCWEVSWRAGELKGFLLHDYHKPCDRSEWKCPPKDREGSVENYFRNDFRLQIKAQGEQLLWKLIERYNGEMPPIIPWERFRPYMEESRKFSREHPEQFRDHGDTYEYNKNRWLRERRERRREMGLE